MDSPPGSKGEFRYPEPGRHTDGVMHSPPGSKGEFREPELGRHTDRAMHSPPAPKGEFRDPELGSHTDRAMHSPPVSKGEFRDPEPGLPPPLFPGINPDENALRWAFIRKVYSILSLQLLTTVIVASLISFFHPVSAYLLRTPGVYIVIIILPLILIFPMYYYRQKHPVNFFILALFTIALSWSVGVTCAFTKEKVVWESAVLTATVVVSLTLYTFWASRRGHDFSFLGPFLFTSLIIILLFALIQIFIPLGRLSIMIYGGLASIVFSGFIIYDTDNLIKRFNYDEYLWASVRLYLDVINLFISLLTLFRG